MQWLGVIGRARALDVVAQVLCACDQPPGQPLPPGFVAGHGASGGERLEGAIEVAPRTGPERLAESAHRRAASVLEVFSPGLGQTLGIRPLGRQLVDHPERDVEFADRAEGAGEIPQVAAQRLETDVIEATSEHGHHLAQASRGHSRLVHRIDLAVVGRRPPARATRRGDA